MNTLINRHIKLFLKDKARVFFSLFSVFIIIILYLLFLSENITSNLPEFDDRSAFVFLWLFVGIIVVSTSTASLVALGNFIDYNVVTRRVSFLLKSMSK